VEPRVRDMNADDLDAVLSIERECFPQPWTRAMLAEELWQGLGWRRVAVDEDGRVVGYLLGRMYPDEWHLMNLAVTSGRRRQGLGRHLLRHFVQAAKAEGRTVMLEVREHNDTAIGLYESLGFERIALRRNYYTDTHEDALIMWLPAERRLPDSGTQRLSEPLLAIESSCDDTAAAVLSPSGEVLSTITHSQDSIHERYGGVVPEVASRAHTERMTAVVSEALRQAGCGIEDLGGVAATVGPGLIGALLVGVQTAKAIAWARRLPFFPVNHIHGHLAAAWLADPEAPLPMVTLVASGGHTALIRVDDRATYELLGQTLDDAAGEAFDKGARLLGLGYPGGKELDELAEKGDPRAFTFPVAMKRSGRPDFSFSGVKTALYYLLRGMTAEERQARAADVAASYRQAIVEALVTKSIKAARHEGARCVAIAGGVAANSLLRRRLVAEGEAAGLHVVVPAFKYCTDNAAMIGAAALAGPRLEYPDYLTVDASASLALGEWLPPAS
jgi:N6-L-threonylcarbamoyladenine synthase